MFLIGETRAGKTTLINRFVGTKLFPTNNVAATATVCRIRNSKELILKAYTRDEYLLYEAKFENMEQMKSVIKKFTDIRYIATDIKDKIYYTDVYLPVPILKVVMFLFRFLIQFFKLITQLNTFSILFKSFQFLYTI